MPIQKHSRPDPNVLDLRQLVAERRAAAEHRHRGWSARFSRPTQSANRREVFHRPTSPPRDWALFSRELTKFMVVIMIVGGVSLLTIGITKIVSAKTTVEDEAFTGVEFLQQGLSAIGSSEPQKATAAFSSAQAAFEKAERKLNDTSPKLFDRLPVFGNKLATGRTLIQGATELSSIGQRLSLIMPQSGVMQPAVTIKSDGIIQGSVGVLTPLLEKRAEFVSIISDTVQVITDLENINPNTLPGSIRERYIVWQRLLRGLVGSGESLDNLTDVLIGLLAPEKSKEYLVVFQNNDELRPTGGFLGTYLLVKFEQGTFKILDAPGNGPFALSTTLAKEHLPPQPVLGMAPYWTLHDANWFLDVPTSATAMLHFYAEDRGFTPDGVIFINPGVMEDILRITGPIRPDKYQIDITAENFVAATEQQVQFNYDKTLNNPKQFLIDLVPIMLTKLSQLSGPDALRALALTLKRANQNDFMIYSGDNAFQQTIQKLGWDGSIMATDNDYLAVVDTNIGGGKTDRSIEEKVSTAVTLDGSVLRHVIAITRTHNGEKGNILTGDTNNDFIRVYAPADAQFVSIEGATIPAQSAFLTPDPATKPVQLLQDAEGQTLVDQANGYRITHESGKMVFGAWSRIAPGQSQTITFTYTTTAPNQGQAATWKLNWQHQPGGYPVRQWNVTFNLPNKQEITAVSLNGQAKKGKKQAVFTADSTLSQEFFVSYK